MAGWDRSIPPTVASNHGPAECHRPNAVREVNVMSVCGALYTLCNVNRPLPSTATDDCKNVAFTVQNVADCLRYIQMRCTVCPPSYMNCTSSVA